MEKILDNEKSIKSLAEKLNQYKAICKFDSGGESEAWRIAHSLSDLEKSFIEILENYLPALCNIDNEESVNNILLDIGEELRHILYHIKDPSFFNYLIEG